MDSCRLHPSAVSTPPVIPVPMTPSGAQWKTDAPLAWLTKSTDQPTPAFAVRSESRKAIICSSESKSIRTDVSCVVLNEAIRPRLDEEFATPGLTSSARADVLSLAPRAWPRPVIGAPSSELAASAPSTVGGVAAFASGAPGFKPAGQPLGTQRTVNGRGAPPTVKVENGLKTPFRLGFRLVLF